MTIIEATKIAIAEDKWIYRESDPALFFKPTNTYDCFYIKPTGSSGECGKRWNPNAEDILADDYEVSKQRPPCIGCSLMPDQSK